MDACIETLDLSSRRTKDRYERNMVNIRIDLRKERITNKTTKLLISGNKYGY